ncbi:efflux RND transporter periplasmic adaptor subunit [Pontiellaceae bacterium B12219]|nr:efflux RND transporter periplasmic adaptor subunit [Pontiellaceae bacterium B12219]
MLKQIGIIIGVIVGLVLGFAVRGLLPSGPPPMGMMGMGEMPPPAIKALELQEAPIDLQAEYIATVEPVQQVMVKADVSGYLDAVHFQEGALVKEGDLLFTVDQKRYESMVEVREAELNRSKAELNRAEKYLERINKAGDAGSVSKSDVDQAVAIQLQAVANLKQAEANLTLAKLDLSYSEIRSPINGRIGAAMVTKGNYVDSNSGPLAAIVQMDPIRVVFSLTDRAYLNLREKILGGDADGLVAHAQLPNGTILPEIGKKDFDDNMMDPNTGTMAVRYLFDNPNEMLVAGGYVTALLGKPDRPMGLRVPQQAILVDTDGTYVLTVSEEGDVGMARVSLGDPIENDFVVLSGLEAGTRVVVDGVQKVQPGAKATVTLVEALK